MGSTDESAVRRTEGSRLSILIGLSMLVAVPAQAHDCADDPAVTWKVQGRFSILKGDEARARGDLLIEAIAAADGRMVSTTPAAQEKLSAYAAVTEALVDAGTSGAPPLREATYWNREAERYVDDGDLIRPSLVKILATFATAPVGTCEWTIEGTTTTADCANARLRIPRRPDGTLTAALSVRSSVGEQARTCIAVEESLIIGFGDSYASGEGNPDRPTRWAAIPAVRDALRRSVAVRRTSSLWNRDKNGPLASVPTEADAQWWDNSCHRSLLSQQSLASMAHAARNPHRVVTFLSFSCSGATVIDGIIGPRFETPGASRLAFAVRASSVALNESQLTQTLRMLCKGEVVFSHRPIPANLPVWLALKRPAMPTTERTGVVRMPSCPAGLRRHPDALLLSVGGNDVGFGGVAFWAIVPPAGRLRLPVDFVAGSSVSADRMAAKRDFGLVCPDDLDEKRCRRSAFTAKDLLRELPALYDLMDDALEQAGLANTPVKLHMSYPPVARDELDRLCGELWVEPVGSRHEMQIEPWMPLYANVLDTFRIGNFTPVASFGPWSFGIYNTITADHCYAPVDATRNQYAEMCIIEREVYRPLNRAVAGHGRGWRVISADVLPPGHGICATDGKLAAEMTRSRGRDLDIVLTESRVAFGWPRWDRGWISGWPAPQDWHPYEPRARWFRTATDSALTQTVFDGGTAVRRAKGTRTEQARHEEAASGTIHPTLQMHAAMGERLAEALAEISP